MAELTVTVNGRRYAIGCADGEEDHVARLAADIDRRVAALARSVGPVGDARLLLMAALLIADELDERCRRQAPAVPAGDPLALAAAIEALAARIEAVADRLAVP